MGVRSSINGGVDRAFAKLSELLVDATFITQEVESFDFGAGEIVSKGTTALVVKGFIFYGKNSMYVATTQNTPTRSLQLLIKTEGKSYNFYTKVSILGKMYKPSLINSDEFITQFELQEM